MRFFTKGSHHRNISVLLFTQNLFHQGTNCRDISLNAKYLVVLKNVRDKYQFLYLARQAYLEDSQSLLDAFLHAARQPHGYLILDFAQDTDDTLRFRNNVFPDEGPPIVYVLKTMRRIKSNFHNLHTLKDAQPKLRKAIISNCDNGLENCVSECALNLLHGNVKFSDCARKNLRKYRRQLR